MFIHNLTDNLKGKVIRQTFRWIVLVQTRIYNHSVKFSTQIIIKLISNICSLIIYNLEKKIQTEIIRLVIISSRMIGSKGCLQTYF